MKTIIFDMMGLVAGFPSGYPNFEEILIKPMQALHDIQLGFWTRDRREDYRFREWGSFFVGKEDVQELSLAVLSRDRELLQEICHRTKLKEELMDLESLTLRWNEWYKNRGIIFDGKKWKARHKYPPLLGNDRSILIESDLSGVDSSKRIRRNSFSDESLEFARKTGSSVLLVPEYPNVWEGSNCPYSPEEVLIYLRNRLKRWSGEDVQEDMGLEMGIYPKNPTSSSERR